MIDYTNSSNYKKCARKQYEVYFCKPPINTIVLNTESFPDIVKSCNGKRYFTAAEIASMQKKNPSLISNLQNLVMSRRAFAVTEQSPYVISDVLGNLKTCSLDDLQRSYNLISEGQPIRIDERVIATRMKGKYLDWTVLRSQPFTQSAFVAMFVPVKEKFNIQHPSGGLEPVNKPGVSHGKGDFLVTTLDWNGNVNRSNIRIYSNFEFGLLFNNQGWTDCLSPSKNITVADLPKLISSEDKSGKLTLEEYNALYGAVNRGSKHTDYFFNNLAPRQPMPVYTQHKNAYKAELKSRATQFIEEWKTAVSTTNVKVSIGDIIKSAISEGLSNNTLSLTAKSLVTNIIEDMFNYTTINLMGSGAYINNPNCKAKEYSKALFNLYEGQAISNSYEMIDQGWYAVGNDCISGYSCQNKLDGKLCFTLHMKSHCADQSILVDVFEDGIGLREYTHQDKVTLPSVKKLLINFSTDCTENVYNTMLSMANKIFSSKDSYLAKTTRSSYGLVYRLAGSMELAFTCLNFELNHDDESVLFEEERFGEYKKDNFRFKIHKNGRVDSDSATAKTDTCTIFVKVSNDLIVSMSARCNGKTFDKTYKLGVGHGVDTVAMLSFIDICRLFKLNPLRTLYGSNVTIKQLFEKANGYSTNRHRGFVLKIDNVDRSDTSKVRIRFNICDMAGNISGTRTFVLDFNYKSFDYTKSTSATARTLASLDKQGYLATLSEMMVCSYITGTGMKEDTQLEASMNLNYSISGVAESLYKSVSNLIDNTKKYSGLGV